MGKKTCYAIIACLTFVVMALAVVVYREHQLLIENRDKLADLVMLNAWSRILNGECIGNHDFQKAQRENELLVETDFKIIGNQYRYRPDADYWLLQLSRYLHSANVPMDDDAKAIDKALPHKMPSTHDWFPAYLRNGTGAEWQFFNFVEWSRPEMQKQAAPKG